MKKRSKDGIFTSDFFSNLRSSVAVGLEDEMAGDDGAGVEKVPFY